MLFSLAASANDREYIWKKDKMPNSQSYQIAAMTDESETQRFNADKNRIAYIDWYDAKTPDFQKEQCTP